MTSDLDIVLTAAAAAKPLLAAQSPTQKYRQLVAIADALDAAADDLIPLAMRESHLPEARLTGELRRTTMQLRMFAEVARDASLLEVRIDAPDPDFGSGPRPDIRRMRLPLGVVLNFAASNFPFAFSVAGGDTASALATGCPVIVKAHEGHPRLSESTATIVSNALTAVGAPDGAFNVIYGREEGVAALKDDRVDASTFTGSVHGGLALAEIAASRPRPIPFYGELGSINPVIVTRAAIDARGDDIATGFVDSFTLGSGQFCTKPGLLLMPTGHGLSDQLISAVESKGPGRLLTEGITAGFVSRYNSVSVDGEMLVAAQASTDLCSPGLMKVSCDEFLARAEDLRTEVFGPFSVIVEYADVTQLASIVNAMEGSLTFTVHAEESDRESLVEILAAVTERTGRVLMNGWPTGVAVTPAQQHGGPFPSTTNSLHTAVGTSSVERFMRPVSYQNFYADWLPEPLRDDNPWGVPQQLSRAGEFESWGR